MEKIPIDYLIGRKTGCRKHGRKHPSERNPHGVIDESGKTYGKLYVLIRIPSSKLKGKDKGKGIFLCLCECGRLVRVLGTSLRYGRAKSCGCWRYNDIVKRHKHGRIYGIWYNMLDRCRKDKGHPRYSGRGITVCVRWRKFSNFKEDMEKSYKDHAKKYGEGSTTLDRIDNDGDYTPKNCRWATWQVQAGNRGKSKKGKEG